MPRPLTAKRLSAAAALLCMIPLTGCLFDYTGDRPLMPELTTKPAASVPQTTPPPQIAVTETTAAAVTSATAAETTAAPPAETTERRTAQMEYRIKETPDGTEYAVLTGFQEGVTALPALEIAETPEGIPVTEIGPAIFRGRHDIGIPTLILPPTVTRVGTSAFRDCFLLGISVPAREERLFIGDYAFSSTPRISTLAWSGCNVQFGAHSFSHSGMRSVTLSGDLTMLEECFADCENLSAVTLSDGELQLGRSVFRGCPALETVTLRDAELDADAYFCVTSGIKKLRVENVTGTAGGFFCSACPNLKEVEIGEGITALGQYAFRECTALETVKLPASLTDLDDSWFYGCEQDIRIIAPEGSAAMAFAALHGYDDEPEPEPFKVYDMEKDPYADETYYDAHHTEFPDGACVGNQTLKTLSFADGVKFGSNAFSACRALKKVTVIDCEDAVFGDACFSGCLKLSQVAIQRSTGKIGSFAFSRNPNLETVVLGKGITEIGSGAFSECPALKKAVIPDTVTKIASDAFSGCEDLVISTPKNSAAASFAYANGYELE